MLIAFNWLEIEAVKKGHIKKSNCKIKEHYLNDFKKVKKIDIVKGYSKWFGVNSICAIKELRNKGVAITEEYEHKIRQIEAAKKVARQKNKKNRAKNKLERQTEFSDAQFVFIVGYTSGDAAYGVTHEEMEIQLQEEKAEKIDIDEIFKF